MAPLDAQQRDVEGTSTRAPKRAARHDLQRTALRNAWQPQCSLLGPRECGARPLFLDLRAGGVGSCDRFASAPPGVGGPAWRLQRADDSVFDR